MTALEQIKKEAEELYPAQGRNPNWTAINNLREGYIAGRTASAKGGEEVKARKV
jgi:hypothetical protein